MGKPSRILFADVETTGLHSKDRVVSLGMFELDIEALRDGQFRADGTYLIFDPGKKSHPRAEAVHGWSDWILRHQEPFADYADQLLEAFDRCDLIVAHNAEFDRRFIEAEFATAGKSLPRAPYFCTMQAYRSRIGGRSGLDAVLARMGLARSGAHHGALEDAWMAMSVYLWLEGIDPPSIDLMPRVSPQNLLEVPPEPDPLPRRSHKKRTPAGPEKGTAAPEVPVAELDDEPEVIRLDTETLDRLAAEDPAAALSRLWSTCRPTATLIMWVANADGSVDDNEAATLAALVAHDAERIGLGEQADLRQDIVAAAVEMKPTQADVDAAVAAIVNDQAARAGLPNWVRRVAFADGKGTAEERDAIKRIAAAFRELPPETGAVDEPDIIR